MRQSFAPQESSSGKLCRRTNTNTRVGVAAVLGHDAETVRGSLTDRRRRAVQGALHGRQELLRQFRGLGAGKLDGIIEENDRRLLLRLRRGRTLPCDRRWS